MSEIPMYFDKFHFRNHINPWCIEHCDLVKNLDATIEWAIAHGLDKASEFVLTGGSAGGLSTFLHSDRVAAKVQAAAPACKKILAAPVVGYFLDHDNFGE